MSIYITGDTHGHIDVHKLATKQWKEGANLTKDDFLIILGDFGFIWNLDSMDDWWLNWLNERPWTTLFIDGNHDNHPLIDTFPEVDFYGGRAHKINKSVYHLMRGYIFDLPYNDTTKSFAVMGGAESIDKAWRVEGVSWWPTEIPNDDERQLLEKNLEARNWTVNYMLTHDAPNSVIPKLGIILKIENLHANEFENWLGGIEYKLNFDKWYFGHWHTDYDLDPLHVVLYNYIEKLEDEPCQTNT